MTKVTQVLLKHPAIHDPARLLSIGSAGIVFPAYLHEMGGARRDNPVTDPDDIHSVLANRWGIDFFDEKDIERTCAELNLVATSNYPIVFLPGLVGVCYFVRPGYGALIQTWVQPLELRDALVRLWAKGLPFIWAAAGQIPGECVATRNYVMPPCYGDAGASLQAAHFLIGGTTRPWFSPQTMYEKCPAQSRGPLESCLFKARYSQLVAMGDHHNTKPFVMEVSPAGLEWMAQEVEACVPSAKLARKDELQWAHWTKGSLRRFATRWGWATGKWEDEKLGTGLDPISEHGVLEVLHGNKSQSYGTWRTAVRRNWAWNDGYYGVMTKIGGWTAGVKEKKSRGKPGVAGAEEFVSKLFGTPGEGWLPMPIRNMTVTGLRPNNTGEYDRLEVMYYTFIEGETRLGWVAYGYSLIMRQALETTDDLLKEQASKLFPSSRRLGNYARPWYEAFQELTTG